MADVIRFEVPGQPVGKGRPRFSRKGGGRTYTPKKTKAWEEFCGLCVKQSYKGEGFECIVGLDVVAVFRRPKRMRKEGPREWRKGKPDGDNILKIIADSLQMCGLIKDDTQIVEWRIRSVYASSEESERVCVRIYKMQDIPCDV